MFKLTGRTSRISLPESSFCSNLPPRSGKDKLKETLMINESDIPILGQPKESEEVALPAPQDFVRKLGESGLEAMPLLDLISMGFSDTNRMEFYLGDYDGGYYVKLMPHHEFLDIAWNNQWRECNRKAKEAYAQKEEFESVGSTMEPEWPESPLVPKKCVWTDHGMMYNINMWQDNQNKHIFDVLHSECLSKIDIFAKNKRKREEDPWKCKK